MVSVVWYDCWCNSGQYSCSDSFLLFVELKDFFSLTGRGSYNIHFVNSYVSICSYGPSLPPLSSYTLSLFLSPSPTQFFCSCTDVGDNTRLTPVTALLTSRYVTKKTLTTLLFLFASFCFVLTSVSALLLLCQRYFQIIWSEKRIV